jgi:integrase
VTRTIAAWNRLRARQPEAGLRPLARPDRQRRHGARWEELTEPLRTEIDRLLDYLGRDAFADRDFRALRPRSIATRRSCLLLYLGALRENGVLLEDIASLRDAITPDLARQALHCIHTRSGSRMTSHLGQIATTVAMIGRRWLQLRAEQQGVLNRLVRTARPQHEGLAPRNEARLAQLNDAARRDAVLRLPLTIASQVDRAGPPTPRRALAYQTAVLIEIGLMCALRISNIAELAVGDSIRLRQDGGIDIVIGREAIKNGTPFAADLPPTTCRLIRRYLSVYRPLLGDPSSPWLFPGKHPGTHKGVDALRDQITRTMAQVVGVEWHPHLFRHFLAHTHLRADPRADGLVTRALGHKRTETTRAHYIGFQTSHAIALHDALIEQQRGGRRHDRG